MKNPINNRHSGTFDVFEEAHEKGSREWRTFEAIREELRERPSKIQRGRKEEDPNPKKKHQQPGYIEPIRTPARPVQPSPEFGR